MPELPEVEVLVGYLQQVLPGRKIVAVDVGRSKSVRPDSATVFAKSLKGLKFRSVGRRAKYLIFELEHRSRRIQMLGHLGMTGRMYVQAKSVPQPKHTAVSFELDKGRFVFEDTRYFGRLSCDLKSLNKLGPEPLSDGFECGGFGRGLQRSRQAIKVRLLATDLVVGVGNIYASEALFRARIDPRVASNKLTKTQVTRLHAAIRATLEEAIELGSTLPLDWAGKAGRDKLFYFGREPGVKSYEERLLVYGRDGEPCRSCGTLIQRVIQASRSTFFCVSCQKSR